MKRRVLLIVGAFLVVAAIAPTTLRAGDAFWYGVNIEDSGMADADMEAIHDAILTGIENLAEAVGGPTGFPTGDMIGDDRGVRIYKPHKAWNGYTLRVPSASVHWLKKNSGGPLKMAGIPSVRRVGVRVEAG